MKKLYAKSLRLSSANLTPGSVVTCFVDQQVASNTHGVLAIVKLINLKNLQSMLTKL
jgi:hypothetical protein